VFQGEKHRKENVGCVIFDKQKKRKGSSKAPSWKGKATRWSKKKGHPIDGKPGRRGKAAVDVNGVKKVKGVA